MVSSQWFIHLGFNYKVVSYISILTIANTRSHTILHHNYQSSTAEELKYCMLSPIIGLLLVYPKLPLKFSPYLGHCTVTNELILLCL